MMQFFYVTEGQIFKENSPQKGGHSMSNCTDCIQAKSLDARLSKQENTTEVKNDEFEKRITALERKTDTEHERTSMLFKMLAEIKDSLKVIGDKLEKFNEKDTDEYKAIKIGVIVSSISAIAGILIGKVL